MASETKRIEIGFAGGQVAHARVADDALDGLRDALRGDKGWHDLASEDDSLSLDLDQVAFIRIEGSGQSIGFSGS